MAELKLLRQLIMSGLAMVIIIGCGGSNGGSSDGPSADSNHPPSVFAGNDRTIAVGNTVTLDGSQCSDSDGDFLAFNWRFASRPQGSSATLSDHAATNPEFLADEAGSYIIELSVSDGSTAVTDSVIITASEGYTGLDCSQIVPGANMADDFVCAHNAVRANAQPTPSPPLPEMTWDPQLAQIAQDYAETCTWGHNKERGENYPGSVGENMYMEMGLDSTPETAIQAWADEARDYNYANATCPSDKECGHYTQLVWRESIKVGCAMVFCRSVANSNFTNADLYVCDYSPTGNYRGEKPY